MGCTESTAQDKASFAFDPVKIKPSGVIASAGDSGSRPSTPQHEFLTDEEKQLVRADWEQFRQLDQQQIGVRVFQRIFQLEPSAKLTFEAFRHLDGDELTRNTMFRCHAARFMRAVAVPIDNIDDLDVIATPNLLQLGRIHRRVPGLSRAHLDAFEQAMIEVWTAELRRQSTSSAEVRRRTSAAAWKKLLKWITGKVYEGYQGSEDGSGCSSCCGSPTQNGTVCNGAK